MNDEKKSNAATVKTIGFLTREQHFEIVRERLTNPSCSFVFMTVFLVGGLNLEDFY